MDFMNKSTESMATRMYGNIVINCLIISHLVPLLMVYFYVMIKDEMFCVHGGLSPDIHALDQVRELNRKQEIPT